MDNETMNFSEALEWLKQGKRMTRQGWNGKGMWLELQIPDENSKMTRPYVYMVLPKGSTSQFGDEAKDFDRVPWFCSQTDLLENDWVCIS